MTELRDLFDELAATPAPARPVSGGEVYAAGRRRRRQRTVTAAALAVLSVVAGTMTLRGTAGGPVDPPPPAGRVTASPEGREDPASGSSRSPWSIATTSTDGAWTAPKSPATSSGYR